MGGERGKRRKAFLFFLQLAVFGICFFVGAIDLSSRLFPASAEAERLPSAAHPVVPTRLIIPALHIDTAVEKVGVNWKGNMAVPSSYERAGWYEKGPQPGGAGNAVIAAHLNNGIGLSGAFARLPDIRLQDRILVIGEDDTFLTFEVTKISRVDADHPPEAIFKGGSEPQLVLITCDGVWLPSAKTYDKRLVIYAELVVR